MTDPTPTPTAPDWRALCQELLQAIDDDVIDTNDGPRFQAVVDRTRAALATPPAATHEAAEPTYMEVVRLRDELDTQGFGTVDLVAFASEILRRFARPPTRAAEPLPQAEISDEEIDQLESSMWESTGVHEQGQLEQIFNYRAFARAVWDLAVLARWGGAAVQPVAVSERPWERPGWLDEEGRCWSGEPEEVLPFDVLPAEWKLVDPTSLVTCARPIFLLPHWALPVPAGDKGEGQA